MPENKKVISLENLSVFKDKIEEEINKIGNEVTAYDYFYPESYGYAEIFFPTQKSSDFVLREFSAKGKGIYFEGSELGTYFDPTEVYESPTQDQLAFGEEGIFLYQTGDDTNESVITTSRYGYDKIDVINKKVVRYCIPLTFAEFFELVPKSAISWTGTAGNGRLLISHATLANVGIYCENGFIVNAFPTHELTFSGISTTNFAIGNLKSIEGITNKATAISILSAITDTKMVFKRMSPIYENFAQYGLEWNIKTLHVQENQYLGVFGFDGCIQSSFLSLEDICYTKTQTDAKFIPYSYMDDKTYLTTITDETASQELYSTIAYKRLVWANFREGNDGTVPFSGQATFIWQRYKINETDYKQGFYVINMGKCYWWDNESVTEIFATLDYTNTQLALKADKSNTYTRDYIDANLQNVREVAEGKCRTFVISYDAEPITETFFTNGGIVYKVNGDEINTWSDFQTYISGASLGNAMFNSQNDDIETMQEYILTEDNIIIKPDDSYIKTGDIILVTELNVPDRWCARGQQSHDYYKLETSKMDLSDYARLSLGNTFNGNNIFNGTSFFDNSVDFEQDVSFAGPIKSSIYPQTSNTYDLGINDGTPYYWKNLYLSGKISLKSTDTSDTTGLQLTNLNGNTWKIGTNQYGTLRIAYGTSEGSQSQVVGISNTNADFGILNIKTTRNLTDGTNSYSVAESFGALFNKLANGTTIIKWSEFCVFDLSANTTLTFETPKSSSVPEYKAIINNNGASSITLTFTGVTNILCNDDNCTITNATDSTLVLPTGVSIEISVLDNMMIAVNFEAQ